MRSLPLLLIVAAALLAPGQALAGGRSAPTSRAFVITGLVLGDQKIDASGKLGIQGDQLFASVGCNSIGGKVSVDGDTVTITEPLIQTEMACPGVAMDTEAALVKILQHGPFRLTATSWDGDGAQILVEEVDAPAPDRTLPPDQPVGSSPGPIEPDPGMSCPPVQIDPGFTGGSTGSGGSGTGVGATGGGTAPDAGAGGGSEGNASSGENPTGTAVAEPAGTGMTEPVEVPPATPATEPGGAPDPNATPGLDDGPAPSAIDAPPPSGVVEPDPGTPTDPGIGIDPGIGKPPVDDPCARYYANDLTSGAGAGAVPPQADGVAAAEHDKAASFGLDAASIAPAAAGALVVLLGFAALVARRWRATRRATPLGTEADASR